MADSNEDIIGILYRLYEQAMYYAAFKILHDEYLAEDAVHEAFLRLIRNRKKIVNPESPEVRRYVSKTLRSAALDIYRKQKRLNENCLALDETIENTIADKETIENIPLSLIAELPPKYASVMRCLFLDELSIRETAAVLNISDALVRKRYERARKLLKPILMNTEKETYHAR